MAVFDIFKFENFELLGNKTTTNYYRGGATFSPNSIPNIIAWYDADDSTTLFEDSAGTTPALDNADVIGRWLDKSGNDYHVTQATTANKATLRLAVQNGKNVIRFDGTDDFLANAAFPDFGDIYTIFIVIKLDADGDTSQGVYSVSNGTYPTGFGMYQATNLVSFMRGASASHDVGNVNRRDGNFYIHSQTNTGTQNQFRTNAIASQTAAYTAPNPNTLNRLDIGRINIAGWNFKGDMAELIIYNRNLSSDERNTVRDYLNMKWTAY